MVIMSALTGVSGAQVVPPDAGQPPAPTGAPQPAVTEQIEMPVSVSLGLRASAMLVNRAALRCVVVVRDDVSYLDAIGAWTPSKRFPVLFDDGTWQAREDIARFVRAYKPEQVFRWESERAGARIPRREPFKVAVDSAVASAWDEPVDSRMPDLIARWRAIGVVPPGVIVASTTDDSWTAAVALAAARAQPIIWYSHTPGVNRAMEPTEAQSLSRFIVESCDALGLQIRAIGDEVDAVTLCLSTPIKVRSDAREMFSTTDLVVRAEAQAGAPQFAWCGIVFGSEARCSYTAMCSLFLPTTDAWLFDAYPASAPWTDYSTRKASDLFRSVNLGVTDNDPPDEGERSWDAVAASPLDATVVMLNTKGQRDFFELGPRRAPPGEIPFLARPAIAHVIHSWSANQPDRRETVAGRWLERGVYCYYGSVQEPTLQGFVPPEKVAARLLSGMPVAAACHYDDAPAWKCTLIGDPLSTLLRAMPMVDDPCPLDGVVDVAGALAEDLKGERFAEALTSLSLLGRDEDAARLARAVLKDKPDGMTPEAAGVAIWALMRAGDRESFVRCYRLMSDEMQRDPQSQDALWAVAWPLARSGADRAAAELFSRHVREDQLADDSFRLATVLDSAVAPGAGQTLISASRARITDERERTRFDQDIRRLSGRGR